MYRHTKLHTGMVDDFYWDTVVPPYLRVIRSRTYRDYVKPRIIPNVIHRGFQEE
jgi:hypothetical protein